MAAQLHTTGAAMLQKNHRDSKLPTSKARQEYENRHKKMRDVALGDYDEDQDHLEEEHAETEETQQMQPEPPKQQRISPTIRKSHTVLDAVSQQVGVSLDDSDSDSD